MSETQLEFNRRILEQRLTDTAYIYQITKVDDNRGGETETESLWKTLPCRVTRPIQQLKETDEGFSPHTEERWDIAVSADTMEAENLSVLKGWRISVRNRNYIVLDGGEEQTDAMLYHIAVERVY